MLKKTKLCFAPSYVFSLIMEYTVFATFDLVIQYANDGVIVVKRKIAPYKGQWALPGLRIMKPERVNDVIQRIAMQELGLTVNPDHKTFLGQCDGKFRTRQDISTGYLINQPILGGTEIRLNAEHFSSFKIIHPINEIPNNMGSMYRFYIERYAHLHSVNV